MTVTLKLLIVTLLLSIGSNISAQIKLPNKDKVYEYLQSKDQRKTQRAEKLLSKAEKFTLRADENQKHVDKALIRATPYYQQGYKLYYTAYYNHIKIENKTNELSNSDNVSIEQAVKSYRQGKQMYRKAENTSRKKRQLELIKAAGDRCSESLIQLTDVILNIHSSKPIEKLQESLLDSSLTTNAVDSLSTDSTAPLLNLPKDTIVIVSIVNTTSIAAPQLSIPTPTALPVISPIILPESPKFNLTSVFLTVQLLASKTPISDIQKSQLCSKPNDIMVIKSNDWFRYTIGKFATVDDAKKFMSENNLAGIVVAFNKNERITVQEALSLIFKTTTN